MKNKSPNHLESLGHKILETLRLYIKTQFLIMLVTAFIIYLTLSFLGVRIPFLLACITGSLAVVPMVGILTAALIAALVATFDGLRFLPSLPEFTEGIAIFAIFGILNILLDYFMAPYLIGKFIKIHPLLMLLVVIVGSALFGLVGSILAVPVVLVLSTVVDHYK